MSSTRTAAAGTPFKQSRYASSPEFERGLLANLVAMRTEVLEREEDRELIWFVQLQSWKVGLSSVARALLEKHPEAPFSQRVRSPHETYNDRLGEDVTFYESAEDALPKFLADLCLDPEKSIDSDPYWFKGLSKALRAYFVDYVAQRRREFVLTEVGKLVCESLDYAKESKRLTLTDGNPRIGKSEAAEYWCATNPGSARYVQLTSTNDEKSFYREIAKSLGVSINLNSKAQELRHRIEEVLQRSKLTLVIDEAHYLWPNLIDPRTLPVRINWLMTALVNRGVPVGLITTPQFLTNQRAIENATRWTGEQFTGRIGHYQPLPVELSEADLRAVVKALAPEADANVVKSLVKLAAASTKYLAAVQDAVDRARFLAKREGHSELKSEDFYRAIKENILPSDAALTAAIQQTKPRLHRARNVSAIPLQAGSNRLETKSDSLVPRRNNPCDENHLEPAAF